MKRKLILFILSILSFFQLNLFTFALDASSESGLLWQVYNPSNVYPVMEKEVIIKADSLTTYSESLDWSISQQEIKDRMLSPKPDEQPTFSDITFLQLKTISNLIDIIQKLKAEDLSVYFSSADDYSYYKDWVVHFGWYSDKQTFVDAFSWWITLKDIWVWNDVIAWLSKRTLCEFKWGTCTDKIKILKKWKYEFYTLEEIVDWLFSNKWSRIWDTFIDLYDSLTSISSLVSGLTWTQKTFVDAFLWKLFNGDINNIELDAYDIWYWLKVRLDNLNAIKQWFLNKQDSEKINLLWVFNFYNEINNIVKWAVKWTELKVAASSNNITWFITELSKIDLYENMDMKWERLSIEQSSMDLDTTQSHTDELNSSSAWTATNPSTNKTLKIYAAGDWYGGWPIMKIIVNWNDVFTTEVRTSRSSWNWQTVDVDLWDLSLTGTFNLQIAFTNNACDFILWFCNPFKNRNLYVRYFSYNWEDYLPWAWKYVHTSDEIFSKIRNISLPYIEDWDNIVDANWYLEFTVKNTTTVTNYKSYNCTFNWKIWDYIKSRYNVVDRSSLNCEMRMKGWTIVDSPLLYGSSWFAKSMFDKWWMSMYRNSSWKIIVSVDAAWIVSRDPYSKKYFNLSQ